MRMEFNAVKKQLQMMSTLSRIPLLTDIERYFQNFRDKFNLTEKQAFVHPTSKHGLPALRFVLKYMNRKYSYVVPMQIEDYTSLKDKYEYVDKENKFYLKRRKINEKTKYFLLECKDEKCKVIEVLDVEELNYLENEKKLKYWLD